MSNNLKDVMDALIHSTLRDGWWVSLRYSKGNTTARTAVPLKKVNYIIVYRRGGYYRKKDEGGTY